MFREKMKDGSTRLTGAAITMSDILTAVRDTFYPIGKIYISVDNDDPGTLFGGTWVAWGTGRVPVGVDISQAEFDGVEETGGEKTHLLTVSEMPSHSHIVPTFLTDTGAGTATIARVDTAAGDRSNNGTAGGTTSVGGDTAHNNLQPYITCYMWKRTA